MKQHKPETIADRQFNSSWLGRSLDNYKAIHRERCPEVMQARTLTQARIAVYGPKSKKIGVCGCKQERCERYGRGKSDAC